MKWFVKNLVTVLQSIHQPVCQTNISLLSKHCQTSDQCTHDGLSKSGWKWPHLLMSGPPRQRLLSDIKMLALKILIKVFFNVFI